MVDLETTGTDPRHDAITEIGAVRVVGGEVVEEFQTFVNPERDIPAFIARLTGITNHMVRDAPTAEAVLPMFIEFARTSVLVAHNARFDIGFLKSTALRLGYSWPSFDVVDTLALARRTFGRDEVPNHRLGTLAAAVGATTVPNHRALSDARATVDILHAAIERLAGEGAKHLCDLTASRERATSAQISKRHLAADVPAAPGVYAFMDASGQALYVGKSLNLRSRVRSYFTPAEKRRAVLDVIPALDRIDIQVCTSDTEASIRELRLIQEHRPPANRQGVRPSTGNWLRLGKSSEGLRAARKVTNEDDGCVHIGPLRSRHDIEPIRSLLYSFAAPGKLSDAHADLGAGALGFHEQLREAMTSDPNALLELVAHRMRACVGRGEFERAASVRQKCELFLNAAARAASLRSLSPVPLIVAARRIETPEKSSGPPPGASWYWEVLAICYGRLLDARVMEAWEDPRSALRDIAARASDCDFEPSPLAFGHHHETELLARWLTSAGVRIVHVDGEWSVPCGAAFDVRALEAAFARTKPLDDVLDSAPGHSELKIGAHSDSLS